MCDASGHGRGWSSLTRVTAFFPSLVAPFVPAELQKWRSHTVEDGVLPPLYVSGRGTATASVDSYSYNYRPRDRYSGGTTTAAGQLERSVRCPQLRQKHRKVSPDNMCMEYVSGKIDLRSISHILILLTTGS